MVYIDANAGIAGAFANTINGNVEANHESGSLKSETGESNIEIYKCNIADGNFNFENCFFNIANGSHNIKNVNSNNQDGKSNGKNGLNKIPATFQEGTEKVSLIKLIH